MFLLLVQVSGMCSTLKLEHTEVKKGIHLGEAWGGEVLAGIQVMPKLLVSKPSPKQVPTFTCETSNVCRQLHCRSMHTAGQREEKVVYICAPLTCEDWIAVTRGSDFENSSG